MKLAIIGLSNSGKTTVFNALTGQNLETTMYPTVTGEPNLGVLTDPAHLLVTAAQPVNVDTVIVDGRVLKRGGALTATDLPQIREDARRALAGVRARAVGA